MLCVYTHKGQSLPGNRAISCIMPICIILLNIYVPREKKKIQIIIIIKWNEKIMYLYGKKRKKTYINYSEVTLKYEYT